jgi:molybdopterin-containing oxidoreductase family iron-sulfur binding subunit
MTQDQCPSTVSGEKRQPSKAERLAMAATAGHAAGTVNGQRVWRSMDEAADAPEFREFLEREFPAGASELSRAEDEDATDTGGESRRTFLKLMGASAALAGAATIPGCRRPEHKILTYSREVPEEIIPGKPLFYATSWARPDGGAEGLLVETHEGRPTKLEGNPLHPVNRGRISTWALASILSLYDPDRLKFPIYDNPARGQIEATWDDFRAWCKDTLPQHTADQGAGLAFIADTHDSPTREAMRARVKAKWPNATWVYWNPMIDRAAANGTAMAFGSPRHEVLDISKANTRVVVALDRDFLSREANEVPNQRMFAAARRAPKPIKDSSRRDPNDQMVRLYAVESTYSLTGSMADHRLRLSPSNVSAFAVALAKFLLPKLGDPQAQALASALGDADAGGTFDQNFLEACARDLLDAANRGKSLIVAGPSQPAIVHALAAAMNTALGNVGKSVRYAPMADAFAADGVAGLASLTAAMNAGTIKTVVCLETNPVYDAPGDLGFAEAFAKVPSRITLSVEASETAAASTWTLNAAHYLESWGDTRTMDGAIAPVQPMIAPLYAPAMSQIELLAVLLDNDPAARVDGYDLVRATWREVFGVTGFERLWRRALHDGLVASTVNQIEPTAANMGAVAGALAAGAAQIKSSHGKLQGVLAVGQVYDGRFANNAWLQELPDTGTRVVWDNPALMSPATATALGLEPEYFRSDRPSDVYTKQTYPAGRMANFTIAGKTVSVPVWVMPGMADDTVIFTAGYGRNIAGRVGDGVGFNVYPLRSSGASSMALGDVTAALGEGSHDIASTQNHWTMESRTSIVRAVDVEAWHRFGATTIDRADSKYNTVAALNFAERLGELSHTPPNVSIYVNPYNRSQTDPTPEVDVNKPDHRGDPSKAPFAVSPQWGMTIDQNACTGCGACTIACQAENNIPVVGKKEVMKGREMAWIRVDRYFTGDDINNPSQMLHQPVACVHCENAPCEVVCPVNATVHGPEGHNYMTYNRCIGTRYCANNCPYKVRRFNFFDYGVTKFNGDYYGKDLVESVAPDRNGITGSGTHNLVNPNLIPPRLREKVDQISRMQKNPNVTVRSRGVMEKCTYCIQRTNAAKIECKLHDLYGKNGVGIPDGFVQTACQQACPSDAIVFGDILDPSSSVSATRGDGRSYGLLNYLNTRPRTSHMLKLFNPNPELCDADRKHGWDDPFHGHGGGVHGEGHDDHGHGADGHAVAPFRFDATKRRMDKGYVGSLGVLASAPSHRPVPALSPEGAQRRMFGKDMARRAANTSINSTLDFLGDTLA